MIALDAWALVRPSLPAAVAREVEESQPADLRAAVALVEPHLDSGRAWWLWRDALSSWAREQTDARDVLRALTLLDRRLGVWCACAVARVAMPYRHTGAPASYVSIEAAEQWVRGEAIAHVFFANASDSEAADYAARIAADAAYFASVGGARTRCLRDLCPVAADAVLSMPWEVTQ